MPDDRDTMTGSGLEQWMRLLDAVPAPDDAEYLFSVGDATGRRRRANLVRYLTLLGDQRPTTLLLSEAPGYRGTTVTGIPFMSAREATAKPGLVTGDAAGDGFLVPADAPIRWEASSAAVWNVLGEIDAPLPVLWATYPHHPFVAGDPLTNRAPRRPEVAAGIPVALALAALFGIERIVAVGRVAQRALLDNGVEAAAVRHPAQGGARIFAEQVTALSRGPH
jgi:hypothetical protein